MLIACTVPLYSTIYQNYWTIGKNPVKGSVETCQPCPTGFYTCAYCSSCLRYVNCTLCNLGFTFIKLGINVILQLKWYANAQQDYSQMQQQIHV